MKKLYTAVIALMVLSFIGTAALLLFMPDTIPAHYNWAGEVDRYGSKYESLLFPALTIAASGIFLALAKAVGKKDVTQAKVLLYTALFVAVLFTGMGFYYMQKAIRLESNPAPTPDLSVWKFTGVALGTLLLVVGNVMPKARRNAVFGLRTKWSMSSNAVWQKSQRFGGFASVVCGAALAVISLLAPESWCLAILVIVMAVWVAACVAASYRFYKQDGGKSGV